MYLYDAVDGSPPSKKTSSEREDGAGVFSPTVCLADYSASDARVC